MEEVKYQYREIGETDWMDCSFDMAMYYSESPIHDWREKPLAEFNLPYEG